MKKTLFIVAFSAITLAGFAQGREQQGKEQKIPYEFTDVKTNEITGAKDQGRAGICWSFGTMAMIESDVIKAGKGTHDLSELWIVRHTYLNKVKKYVRMHGYNNLGQGGNAHDLTDVIAEYGVVPEEVYRGLNYGTDTHVHGEIDEILINYAKAIVANPNKTLTPVWLEGVEAILDIYFGKRPETFTYQGKEYTPISFAKELGIDATNYVSITSFSHHPFYTAFPLEIPDNWAWKPSINVPLEEFDVILDECINNGYTVSWGSDVSGDGFVYNKGFAVLPETNIDAIDNLEKARWVDLTPGEAAARILKFDEVVPEIKVTQESRQIKFDNYTTTDDHGMQIYGIAKDQNGKKFYKVKNSWGTNHIMQGCFYASQPFFLEKTTNFLVNKNALSSKTKKKLGIE